MFKTTLQDLKNLVKVANHTGKPEDFKASLKNKEIDRSIVVTYSPKNKENKDTPPYWKITIRNREAVSTVLIYDDTEGRREVRDIYNTFILS